MNLVAQRIAQAHPDTNRDWGARIDPIQEAQFGYLRQVLYLLFGIATFVLLISCANVANLLLGRLASRSREVSVRAALGATRSRLIAQFMSEGIILGLIGGGLGLLLSHWGVRLFMVLTPASFPLPRSIEINMPVFLFCAGISVASGAVLSLTPALLGSQTDLNEVLKAAPHLAGGRRHGGYRRALVVAEVALSLVLLFGAGLMINSFLHLMRIDPGMRDERVLTMRVFLTGPRYDQTFGDGVHIEEAVGSFYRRLLEEVAALPWVESAGLVSWLPEGGYNTGRRERSFSIPGATNDNRSQRPLASFNAVSADYFKTLQIPLLQGRFFTARDDQGSPWVTIVNRAFARRYWPGENPIGKHLLTDGGVGERSREVVGVVGDVRQDTLERQPEPEIFAPFLQQTGVTSGHGYQNRVHMTLVVRTTARSLDTVAAVRKLAADMDPSQPVYAIRTMSEVLADSMSVRQLYTTLLDIFACLALFLSAVGLYSAVSQSVSERTHEIGIRMAIGATRGNVVRLVFGEGAKLMLGGSVAGLALALTLNRLLSSYLFGISANDPITLITASGVLLAMAAAAMWLPVRRATRVDAMVALRDE